MRRKSLWINEYGVFRKHRNHQGTVIGCSFYKADVGRFIDLLHTQVSDVGPPRSVAAKIAAIRISLAEQQVLLLLDGLEAIQNNAGEITNPYLREFIEGAQAGRSTVLVTSRVGVPGVLRIALAPLSENATITLLRAWSANASNTELRQLVRSQVGTHALSARIVAGYLAANPAVGLAGLTALDSLAEVPDEADPLRANKASRLLTFYDDHLSPEALALLTALASARRSVPYEVAMEMVTSAASSLPWLRVLYNTELDEVLLALLRTRLIFREDGDSLTFHPLRFSLERAWHVDALIAINPRCLADAEREAHGLLNLGKSRKFSEVECAANRALAAVLYAKAVIASDAEAEQLLQESQQHAIQALHVAADHLLHELEIRAQLALLRAQHEALKRRLDDGRGVKWTDVRERASYLIARSGFRLYEPELRGVCAVLESIEGRSEFAATEAKRAIDLAASHGNQLFLRSYTPPLEVKAQVSQLRDLPAYGASALRRARMSHHDFQVVIQEHLARFESDVRAEP